MEIIFKPFCSQISCLKFVPSYNDNKTLFVVGSYLDKLNSLTLMSYENGSGEPYLLSKFNHKGDVMDIQFNNKHNRLLTTSSNGSLNILSINAGDVTELELDVGWDNVCSGPISGALFNDERIIAVSEDGSILGIRLLDKKISDPSDIFEFRIRDSAGVNAVEQIDQHSFVTVNGFGQLKLWDTRTSKNSPQWTNFRTGVSSEVSIIHCLARHPGQPNVLASGGRSCVCIWDLRQSNSSVLSNNRIGNSIAGGERGAAPVQLNTQLEGSDVWHAKFHPTRPQNLLLATSCGGLINICSSKSKGSSMSSFDWADYPGSLATLSMTHLIGGDNVNMTYLDVSEDLIIASTDKELLCLAPTAAVGL